MTGNLLAETDWVPASCTLPTVDQPLRRSEFDDFLAQDAVSVDRISHQEVRLQLRPEPEVAARAATLATKETGCCSFFTFELTITRGDVALIISAAPVHEQILAGLAARLWTRTGSAGSPRPKPAGPFMVPNIG